MAADLCGMQDQLDTLRRTVERHANGARCETVIPRVSIGFARQPSKPNASLYQPMLCLVLQGAKQVMIGDQVLRYDPACCFIASLELPASGCIIEASPAKPYVAVSLILDRDALASLLADMDVAPDGQTAGFAVSPVTPDLLHAWQHLLALLDSPHDVAVLAPLREREILYRLLQGPHGGVLRQIVRADSRLSQVRRAVTWLKAHFELPMRVEALAEIAGMSLPSFHRHFKAATAMSPLQYQKTLRLQAARRLLVAEGDASRAAYSVGYESASQFSREYARLFGLPPSRDAERLRGLELEEAGTVA